MRFDGDDMAGAEFHDVDLTGARFQNVNLTGARLREAVLVNARLSGLIDGLVVNDIEVAPLIHAELNRRHPERARLQPNDADGAREVWALIEDLWVATMRRVHELPEAMRHERVDGEWSFLEKVVAARDDRMDIVRRLVAGLHDEEWHHHWYATRDLDALTASADGPH